MSRTKHNLGVGSADTRYLKLDASNDPITGAVTIKPSVDSATALEVQNSAGTTLFTVDTVSGNIKIKSGSKLILDM